MARGLDLMGTLLGTLTSDAVLGIQEAENKRRAEELARSTAQATQGAQTAQTAYQGMAAAPPPELPLSQMFIPTLFGNIASVIAQDPGFKQRAQENIQADQARLLKQRADNLMALRDIYGQRAEAAERAQNLEVAEKMRASAERTSKLLETIRESQRQRAAVELEGIRHTNEMDREKLRAKTDIDVARIQAGAKPKGGVIGETPDWLAGRITTTQTGYRFLDLGDFVGNAKTAAIKWATENGIPALGGEGATALKDVDRARRDVTTLWAYLDGLVPRDATGRVVLRPGMTIGRILQTEPRRAAFKTYRDVAIPVLRALAGSRGLRITQQQIKLSVENLPRDTDTYETALEKIGIINTVLDNAEAPFVTSEWKPPVARPVARDTTSRDTTPVIMISPAGKRREVQAWEVPEAVKHGWKRSK